MALEHEETRLRSILGSMGYTLSDFPVICTMVVKAGRIKPLSSDSVAAKVVTRAFDLAGQEGNDEPEHDLLQELAEYARASLCANCITRW